MFLFTNEYPYGNSETYIENELKVLSGEFSEIVLFPLNPTGSLRELSQKNIKTVVLFPQPLKLKLSLVLSHFLLLIKIGYWEFKTASQKKQILKKIPEFKSRFLQNVFRSEVLKQYIQKNCIEQPTYYSFWTDDWATTLSILRYYKFIPGFVSRVHGYDLYKERWPDSVIPFRYFQLKYVCKLFTVSKDGLDYMRNNYPGFKEKFFLSRLNVFDNGNNPWVEGSTFTIVSCSNLIPLKRVELIIYALSNLQFEINWIHFGDGVSGSYLKNEARKLRSPIRYNFMGSIANANLIEFYKKEPVHLFIHVSETEGGVPVAIQEAVSFGIPVMATNVGGVKEIVHAYTGVLVEKNVTPAELAHLIFKFKNSPMNTFHFRKKVKAYWQLEFDADKNYRELYNKLLVK